MKDRNSGRCAHCQNAEQETCQTQRSRCEIRAGVPSEACHAVTFRVSAVPPSGFGRCMRPCPLFDVTGERQLGCSLRRVPGVARKPRMQGTGLLLLLESAGGVLQHVLAVVRARRA